MTLPREDLTTFVRKFTSDNSSKKINQCIQEANRMVVFKKYMYFVSLCINSALPHNAPATENCENPAVTHTHKPVYQKNTARDQ